jgi:murein DD-endopeptidase MepM/ murein hydrolase activator NlpD
MATSRADGGDCPAVEQAGQRGGRSRASIAAAVALIVAALAVPVAAAAPPRDDGSSPLQIESLDGVAPIAATASQPAFRMGSPKAPTVATTCTSMPATTKAGALPFPMCPVPRCDILDSFGDARSGHAHQGVDILATLGQQVYAVADGTLTSQYLDPGDHLAGNGWRLTQPDKTYHLYLHLSAFATGLVRGSVVKRGDLIGYVGDTGNPATGNHHLHFEYHPGGGRAVDALDLFDLPAGCTIT